MLYHRIRVWLERLSEPAEEGEAIKFEVDEAISALEDETERDYMRGFLRTDYLEKVVTGLYAVEEYLGTLRHPSRSQVWPGDRSGDEA